jgi:hypothetical protein
MSYLVHAELLRSFTVDAGVPAHFTSEEVSLFARLACVMCADDTLDNRRATS